MKREKEARKGETRRDTHCDNERKREKRNHTKTVEWGVQKSPDRIKQEAPIPTSNGVIQLEKANSFSTCLAGSQFLMDITHDNEWKDCFYNAVQMEIIQKL